MLDKIDVYDGIKVRNDIKCVHIGNDNMLDEYIRSHKDVHKLVDQIKLGYIRETDQPLIISDSSLYCEILMHYHIGNLASYLSNKSALFKNNRLIRRAIRACEVIDCGESSCDGNRWVWDILQIIVH